MAESTVNHGNTAPNSTGDGGATNPSYVAFVLVPIFFFLGLLGVLICHILKKKGYHCTTESEDEEGLEDEKDPEAGDLDSDTVNQIVHCIMKNEANSDALKAMVHENSLDSDGPVTPTSPSPPTTPLSPGAPVGAAKHTCSHLHTIGGMGGHRNICGRCNQKKWPLMRRSSKGRGERRSQYGEVTMLSVGRFRVTKCDPKPAKTRRTLLITEANGAMPPSPTATEHGAMPPSPTATEPGAMPPSPTATEHGAMPPSPTATEPRSRTTSEQQEENDNAK